MHDLFEAFVRLILEPVVELLIKGPGYLIVRFYRSMQDSAGPVPHDDPDGCVVLVAGILFWSAVMGIVWLFTG